MRQHVRETLAFVTLAAIPLGACLDAEPAPEEQPSALVLGLDWGEPIPGCPGIELTGVDDYAGFAGQYFRLWPYGDDEIVSLRLANLTSEPESIAVTAEYTAMVKRGVIYRREAGLLRALPNNPAIGAIITLDAGNDGSVEDVYFPLGATYDVAGRVATLCLARSGEPEAEIQPFLLYRVGP
jgi:hypothetical protein